MVERSDSQKGAANLRPWNGDYMEFKDYVLSRDDVIVVDFFATWCPGCRRLGMLLPKIAEEFPTVQFLKVDVNSNQELAQEYKVSSIPHIKFFRNKDQAIEDLGEVIGPDPAKVREQLQKVVV